MKNICPVCGYDGLRRPPKDYLICPCCRTEFGNDDVGITHEELRHAWIEDGMRWFSQRTPAPAGWSPLAQIINLRLQTPGDLNRGTSGDRSSGGVVLGNSIHIRRSHTDYVKVLHTLSVFSLVMAANTPENRLTFGVR